MQNQDPAEVAFKLLGQVLYQKQSDNKQALLNAAFDLTTSYTIYHKPKPSGGYRVIAEPPEPLKELQQKLLVMLYRLQKRSDYYRHERWLGRPSGIIVGGTNYWIERAPVHKQVVRYFVDDRMHGSIPGRSTTTAATEHLAIDGCFVTKLDLKDAFPSVKVHVLKKYLRALFYDECKAYYRAYAVRVTYDERYEHHVVTIHDYPRYPLFPTVQCSAFRKLIRDAVTAGIPLGKSTVPKIINCLVDQIVQLVTYEGATPQGAPTSGFLLNLVLSHSKALEKLFGVHEAYLEMKHPTERASIFVDDLIVRSIKRPTKEMINQLIVGIESTGIFKHHPKKIRVYDLRKGSVPILGMKLVRRPARIEERETLATTYPDPPRGLARALNHKRIWFVNHLTLSKKKQRQYRGFLHYVNTHEVSSEEVSKANGYHGHIVSTYGWPAVAPFTCMPASLRNEVQLFREKYHKPQEERSDYQWEQVQKVLAAEKVRKDKETYHFLRIVKRLAAENARQETLTGNSIATHYSYSDPGDLPF